MEVDFEPPMGCGTSSACDKVGLHSWVHPWLGDPKFALITISLVSCWQWVGLPTMMYLAALVGIPEEFDEAARVDGASSWKTFWYIKFPLLPPIIGIVSVLTFIGNFSAFDIVYAMETARGDPNGSTDIMGTMFYRTGIGGEILTGVWMPAWEQRSPLSSSLCY